MTLGPWLDQAQPTRVSWPVSSKERGCRLPRLKLVYDRLIPLRRLWGLIGLRTMPRRFRITDARVGRAEFGYLLAA